MNANGSFEGQQAPCGRIAYADSYEDHDDEFVLTQETLYSCGCKSIQHEYHDGSVSHEIVRHDGHVLLNELRSAQ